MVTANSINANSTGIVVYDGAGTFTGRTITAGTGVSVTNGNGVSGNPVINAVGGGLTWTVVSGATQAMAVNNGYFANRAGVLTFSLPTSSAVGDMVAVVNINTAADTVVSYTTNQQIFIGNTSTTLTTGSLTSTALGDTLILVCRTANLVWQAVSIVGNWTVV